MFMLPVVAVLTLAIVSFSAVYESVTAASGNGGGFYVGSNSTFVLDSSKSISGFSAINGGGIYVDNDATLKITGGVVYKNNATTDYSSGGGGVYNKGTLTFTDGVISSNSSNAGGGVYNTGTFEMTGGIISGNSARDGGGVYNSGTFTMSGGSISRNRISGVYNYGGTFILSDGIISQNESPSGASSPGNVVLLGNSVFTMNGGTIEDTYSSGTGLHIYTGSATINDGLIISKSGSAIYARYTSNCNILGGIIKGDIFAECAKIKTSINSTIIGTINLSDNNSEIILQDYDGTTPSYSIKTTSSRGAGKIMTFVGSDVEPDLTKLNVSGYDTDTYYLKAEKNSDGNWTVVLKDGYDFPTDWKTQIASSTYMTTTVNLSGVSSISFCSSVPTGYSQIGTLSTGLPVYSSGRNIAFVSKVIYAPESSAKLFMDLSNLQSLNLSTLNTSNVTDMSSMFHYCKKLTSLNLSNFNTTNVTNMSNMFNECNNLTSLDISGLNTTNVVNMYRMFYRCKSLTSLDVSSLNTVNVIDMSFMFSDCQSLISLDVSNFNTSNVVNMSFMFSTCTSLTSLDLSDFDTSNVTNMRGMFYWCGKITVLNLSNFNTSNVTDMSTMFSYCQVLPSVDLSNFDTSNVTSMTDMFRSSVKLTSVDLSNFDTSNVTSMEGVFYSCNSLTSVDLSNFNTSNVTNMYCMFIGCRSLTSLDLRNFNMSKVTNSSQMLDFGTSAVLGYIKTPYNNKSVIPITTGSTLYNVATGSVVTSVPANTTSSLTYSSTRPSSFVNNQYQTNILKNIETSEKQDLYFEKKKFNLILKTVQENDGEE